jgi:Carbohydrate binding domain
MSDGDRRRRRIPIPATALALAVVALGLAAAANMGVAARAQGAAVRGPGFPAHYFAPYVDTSLNNPLNLTQTAQSVGVRFYTLAFIISGGSGCQAMWNGVTPVNQGFYQADVNSLRGLGGDVSVSFGGAAGIELGQQCGDVASLQAAYQSVVTNYTLSHVDFDIEGAAVADPASIDRRNRAIAGLQRANAGLVVSYTLPVLPTGLTQDGVNLLQNAINDGVRVDVVNIMTMDYGGGFPANQMGQNAIQAGQSLFGQLQSLFPSRSTAQLWAMEGNTPMIGFNDVAPEVTTQQDARMVLSWAQQNGITELAMWSAGRDGPCPGGQTGIVSATCSGTAQQPFDYSRIFNALTGGTVSPPPSPTPTPVPTTTPRPTPTPVPTPTATPPPPPPGNLVSNPGFESGLAGWSCSPLDTSVGSPVHSGHGALSAAANNSDNAQCTQSISVQPNHAYTLSGWVQGSYAFIGVSGTGTGDTQNFAPSATSFTQLSVSFTTGASTTSVTVFVHGWYAQGTVFVDDLSVR